jgi:RNA polymerase sigma-70 factor (ECF subfamily)
VDADPQELDRTVAGGPDALATLMQRHGPSIARELRRDYASLSAEDVDDVMQVTFLEAFLHFRHFDHPASGSLGGWLRSIARHNVSDLIRSRESARRPPEARRLQPGSDESLCELLDQLAGPSGTPSRAASAREARQALELAIGMLPESYRAVIRRCDLDGQTAEAAGRELGRSAGAVYMLRARAIDRLRQILGSSSRFFSRGA